MIYVLLTISSLALAFWPAPAPFFGRAVSLFSAVSSLVYFLALGRNGELLGVGRLGYYASYDTTLFTPQGITALLLFLLSAFSILGHRKAVIRLAGSGEFPEFVHKISYSILLPSYLVGAYILYLFGTEELISYSGYGSIKDIGERFGSTVTRSIVSSYRICAVLLISATIINLSRRKYGLTLLAVPPILLAFTLALAEASRILAVYFAVAAINFSLTRRVKLAGLAILAAVIGIGYSLEARSHTMLGLAHVPGYLALAITKGDFLERTLTSLGAGLLVTDASANVASPESYGSAYKILSFAPSFGFIDGFQDVLHLHEQRILSYIPFNAFGEAWSFGPLYFAFLWTVVFASAACVTSSMKFGRFPFIVLTGTFILALMFASQYPVRNSVRYFYVLILMRLAIGLFHRPSHPSRSRKRPLAHDAGPGSMYRL